jgi:EAL domain-containing protein (putative c-di-GMP-specific phosphodiesterase class I)
MSVQELDRDDLAGTFLGHLDALGVEATRMGIEITESAMAAEHPVAMTTVAELRDRGVTVVIDDFGTGYSSLSAIKNYPADVVKIDRGFISGILDAPADLAIVRSVVEIGGVIGLEIVAEGVETPDQLRALSAVGCSSAQGFHLARPVPAAAVDAHIEGWLRGDLGAGVEA